MIRKSADFSDKDRAERELERVMSHPALGLQEAEAMRAVFVQLQCAPGRTYEVADALYEKEIVSELYSTSGEYDLLMKIYIEDESDIGKFINEQIAVVPGIVRSLTTLTFKAF